MQKIKDTTLYLIRWKDGDLAIGEQSDTGTDLDEVYVTADELPKLIKALQEVEKLNSQKESK